MAVKHIIVMEFRRLFDRSVSLYDRLVQNNWQLEQL